MKERGKCWGQGVREGEGGGGEREGGEGGEGEGWPRGEKQGRGAASERAASTCSLNGAPSFLHSSFRPRPPLLAGPHTRW